MRDESDLDEPLIPEVMDDTNSNYDPDEPPPYWYTKKDRENMARASTSRKWDHKFCAMIIAHMSEGKSFKSFAAVINVALSTLETWLVRKPEFRDAYELAKAKQLLFFENIGLQGLTMSPRDFNAPLYSFKMKYHKHYTETTKVENTHEVTVKDVSKLKSAELDEQIKQLQAELDDKV